MSETNSASMNAANAVVDEVVSSTMSKDKPRDVWVGFDLGGTKMYAIVFDGELKPIGKARKKTKGFEGVEVGLKKIQATIQEALEQAQVDPSRIRGIGIGCPGPLNIEKGMMLEAPNLGWKNVPIRKSLETAFGCPVVVLNDVDAGVYGEWCFGAGKGARCLVGIFPGTGVGGGCVYHGQIFQGANHSCMEVGHIPLISDSLPDGCGNMGTLEAVASRLAIAAGAAQAVYRGKAPWLQKKTGANLAEIRSGVLRDAVENGDEAIKQLIVAAANHLGLGIVTIVHLLSPEIVVIGGGLAEAFPKLLVKTAEDYAKNRVMPSYTGTFKVVLAKLGDDSGAIGCAAWAKRVIQSRQGINPLF
ncbi:MAG: ROK family protein [Pirellulaceae bacterium]|nr:ROK family protein [Pirellulaceae bacterium]